MIDKAISTGLIPDLFLRKGIQSFLKKRLFDEYSQKEHSLELKRKKLVEKLRNSPVALETDKANDQHYMVPTEFYHYVLGENLKYSCGHWDIANNLSQAEEEMLELTVNRAQIKDGDSILELGHGWGAITLFMAKKFPSSQITAVSNSSTQGDYIREQARLRGYKNVTIVTADINDFKTQTKYDRVISVEMFEHVRNYEVLLNRISNWLTDKGTLFVHIFVHKELSYPFDVIDDTDWMSKYFFSGGIMPSEHLLYYFQNDLRVTDHWRVNGVHYAKTARAWLENMDTNKKDVLRIFNKHYGEREALKWFHYWRVFFMSCEELWKFQDGNEWMVGHYLLRK